MIKAMEMLNASITSSNTDGIGTMKKTTAAKRYKPTPISAFFSILHNLLSHLFVV